MYEHHVHDVVDDHPVAMLGVYNVDHLSVQATLCSTVDTGNLQL
jgi:hypothetical protein